MCYPREKALCVKKVDYWKNGLNAFTSVLRWFASDTAYFCFHPYNIFGEVSVHFYGEEQSFLKAGYSVLIAMMFTFNYWLMLTVMTLKQFFTWQYVFYLLAFKPVLTCKISWHLRTQQQQHLSLSWLILTTINKQFCLGDHIQNYTFFSSGKNLERLLVFVVRVGEEGGAGWCRISAWSGRPLVEIGTLFVS